MKDDFSTLGYFEQCFYEPRCVYTSLRTHFETYPEVRLMDVVVALFFKVFEELILFSIVVLPLYSLINSTQGDPFFQSLEHLWPPFSFSFFKVDIQKVWYIS